MNKSTLVIAIVLMIIAIVLGAFGAHTLKDVLTQNELKSFEVGVRYQMYISLVLLILGFIQNTLKFSIKVIVQLLTIGTILFSGSIYYLSISNSSSLDKIIGPITPIGGLLIILSLIILLIKIIKHVK